MSGVSLGPLRLPEGLMEVRAIRVRLTAAKMKVKLKWRLRLRLAAGRVGVSLHLKRTSILLPARTWRRRARIR